MFSQDDDQDVRVVTVVLIAAVVLAVGLAIGMGVSKSRSSSAAGTAVASSPVASSAVASDSGAIAPEASNASAGDASVVVENGVVKFYFASGKADLASGALVALGDAIAAAQSGKRLMISGFHDSTGGAALNAELAKQRALAVRDALMGAGVAESSMQLQKPEETTGSGNAAEARRVEVVIAD